MIIWKDEPSVPIREKCPHIHEIGGKLHNDFCETCGDVPVAEIRDGKIIPVHNPRGKAYAARKRLMYRKKYRRNSKQHRDAGWEG